MRQRLERVETSNLRRVLLTTSDIITSIIFIVVITVLAVVLATEKGEVGAVADTLTSTVFNYFIYVDKYIDTQVGADVDTGFIIVFFFLTCVTFGFGAGFGIGFGILDFIKYRFNFQL